jgi:DNA polymerase-1
VLAAQAWGGPEDKSNDGRALMKVVWLASQYGAQGETLAQTMAVAGMRGYTPAKADRLLQDMMNTVPRLFQWREEVISEARALGFVTTLGGRRRHLADIDSADWFAMARAERQAVSSLVQGSAADIVRRAMLECRKAVHPQVAKICLQVHDEILWTRQAQWNPGAFELLVDICENHTGFELAVPLVFEATVASSWAAKGSQTALPSGTYDQLNSALVGAGGTE